MTEPSFVTQKSMQVLGSVCLLVVAHYLGVTTKRLVVSTSPPNHLIDTTRQRAALVLRTLGHIVYVAIMVVAVFISLKVVGIEATSVVALLGAAGLALGLAVQGILSDIAAAILMALMPSFTIGDVISMASESKVHHGKVVDFTLTNTSLLDTMTGSTMIVPNRQLLDTIIINHTQNPYHFVTIDVPVSYKNNKIDSVIEFCKKFLDAQLEVLKEVMPTIVGVKTISENTTTLHIKCVVHSNTFLQAELKLKTSLASALQRNGLLSS